MKICACESQCSCTRYLLSAERKAFDKELEFGLLVVLWNDLNGMKGFTVAVTFSLLVGWAFYPVSLYNGK